MSWYLYSEFFINKALFKDISYKANTRKTYISKILYFVQPLVFLIASVPCRMPILDQICEFVATNWSRGLIGFILRGVYWKTKIGDMGQDVFIDRYVTIYPDTKSVFIGNNVHIDSQVTIQISQGLLIIGDNSQILYNSYLNCSPYIILGKGVSIGSSCILYGGSVSLLDEEGKYLPWSSMNSKHCYLLCGIIFEDYSGLVNSVVCCPDPWIGVSMDDKRILNLKPMIIGKWTGVCSNSYIDRSTGEAEVWAGNPAKMIFDYKVKIDRKLKEGVNLLEYVE
jgi:acetyltransferase-like isoleucine patch superfamily enzyme